MSLPFDLNSLGPLMAGFQQRMEAMKAEAASAEVEGTAGGGLVTVVATGGMQLVSVRIDPSAMDDREMLEDLVVAASNDALRKAKDLLTDKLSAATGGLPLPPGLL